MKTKNNNITILNEQQYLIRRLHIIEGQIRGVAKMVEDERTYEEVIMQMSALTNSLKSLSKTVLENYMKNNLNDNNKVDEFISLFNKLG